MRMLVVIALALVTVACEKTIKEVRTTPVQELQVATAQDR